MTTYKSKIKLLGLAFAMIFASSCNKWLDINQDPNNILDAPIQQLLTNATVNLGFTGGSDLFRYSTLLSQQFSGQTTGGFTQTMEYERYNIQASDLNNVWLSLYSTTLSDLDIVIQKANASGSPHYAGVAKVLTAYTYQLIVDAWGNAPYTQALKGVDNLNPVYDNGADIYTNLFVKIDEAIADMNAATSALSPGTNSTIYPGAWADSRPKWIAFANTLKLRMYIHYSKINPTFTGQKITELVNSGATFIDSNDKNFQMAFGTTPNNTNSIHAFELSRPNYLFPNKTLVNLMNAKADPRRSSYFTPFPYTSNPAEYFGASGGDAPGINYSRMHTYLRGTASGTAVPNAQGGIPATGTGALTYSGSAPIRMLVAAEYYFIRAEAALLYGAPGNAQQLFQDGIRASMSNAGVSTADADAFIAAHGTLSGSNQEQLRQIIEQKFIANYGVVMEPWTDYRRTGYPVISIPVNAILTAVPRSLFYAQSEIDLNTNAPAQKPDLLSPVFWDN